MAHGVGHVVYHEAGHEMGHVGNRGMGHVVSHGVGPGMDYETGYVGSRGMGLGAWVSVRRRADQRSTGAPHALRAPRGSDHLLDASGGSWIETETVTETETESGNGSQTESATGNEGESHTAGATRRRSETPRARGSAKGNGRISVIGSGCTTARSKTALGKKPSLPTRGARLRHPATRATATATATARPLYPAP